MRLSLCTAFLAVPAALLAVVLRDPKGILGHTLGRPVEIAVNLAKIGPYIVFGLSSTQVHPQLAALDYVIDGIENVSEELRLDKAIDLVDDFGWNRGFLINVGDVKGRIVDSALLERMKRSEPKLVVEFGTFLGYGTLRLARVLKNSKAELMTVDPDVLAHSVSSSLYEKAGVRDRIVMKKDFSSNVLRELHREGRQIDFLFIDHVKKLYLSDLKLALELKLLAKDCVVVGDNILWPGAPDYKEFMLQGPGAKLFETQVHQTHVEYWPEFPDIVTVSRFLG
ncbi:unnamed protein product [Effrenium voratum]|nr:unnamed protein product [Effrenium voratum]|mmetsp:Transcript_65329/g.156013  ORF Transcript_65329/g.156013 Transcript_65329/m.156013 type:complete len:281 (-) Transcript_65329:173-1015(-)